MGNKDDAGVESKIIRTQDAQDFADQNHIQLFETSAKDNKNIQEVPEKLYFCRI